MIATSLQPSLHPEFPQPSQLTAILYDLDGTLAHTDPLHFQVWRDLLQDYGYAIDEPFYKQRFSGRLNPDIIADLLPQLSASEALEFADFKEAKFRELATQLPPMAGLRALIDWATDRPLKQAVVTNAPPANAHFMLRALQLDNTFEQVILSEDLGIGKPDPAPYRYALKVLGVEANQAIAFEDSPSGIRSAVGAGIPTIGIASTQSPADLYAVGAKLVIADFTAPALWQILTGSTQLD